MPDDLAHQWAQAPDALRGAGLERGRHGRARGRRRAWATLAADEEDAGGDGADPHRRPRHVPVRDRQGPRPAAAARRRRARRSRPGRGRRALRHRPRPGAGLHRPARGPVGRAAGRQGHRREDRRRAAQRATGPRDGHRGRDPGEARRVRKALHRARPTSCGCSRTSPRCARSSWSGPRTRRRTARAAAEAAEALGMRTAGRARLRSATFRTARGSIARGELRSARPDMPVPPLAHPSAAAVRAVRDAGPIGDAVGDRRPRRRSRVTLDTGWQIKFDPEDAGRDGGWQNGALGRGLAGRHRPARLQRQADRRPVPRHDRLVPAEAQDARRRRPASTGAALRGRPPRRDRLAQRRAHRPQRQPVRAVHAARARA